jgi:hypothetical protein
MPVPPVRDFHDDELEQVVRAWAVTTAMVDDLDEDIAKVARLSRHVGRCARHR